MIVHHPDRLHEGVADGGPDEAKAAVDEILAHGFRLGCAGRNILERAPAVGPRPTVHERPEVGIEAAALPLDGERGPGVPDGGRDLQPIAHDAGIGQMSVWILRSS